jgi:hypothetical protein
MEQYRARIREREAIEERLARSEKPTRKAV